MMNYSQRVTLVENITKPGYLGEEIAGTKKTVVPCAIGSLTNNEQIGIFGKYNQAAFKLHLQGIHKDFESIEFEGVERSIYSKRYHRNSTVVVLT